MLIGYEENNALDSHPIRLPRLAPPVPKWKGMGAGLDDGMGASIIDSLWVTKVVPQARGKSSIPDFQN